MASFGIIVMLYQVNTFWKTHVNKARYQAVDRAVSLKNYF